MSEKAEAEARRIYEAFGCMEIWDFAKVIDDVIAAAEKRGRVAGLREAAQEVQMRAVRNAAERDEEGTEDMEVWAALNRGVFVLSNAADAIRSAADKLEAETP